MEITMKLLAEELSAFYPGITVHGEEKQRLTRAASLAERTGGADRETLYCCAAETLSAELPEGLSLALVGTPRQLPAAQSCLLIPGDGADAAAVLSRIQDVLLRLWRWYAGVLELSQGADLQALMETSAPLFPGGIGLLSIWHNRVFCGGADASSAQARWMRAFRACSDPQARTEEATPYMAESGALRQGPHLVSPAQDGPQLVCHVFHDGVRMGTLSAAMPPEGIRLRHFLCMTELAHCAERMYAALRQSADDPLTHALRRMLCGDRLSPAELEPLCRAEGWAAGGHTYRVMVIRAEGESSQRFRCEQLLYQQVISSIYYQSKILLFRGEIVVVRDFTVHDAFEESADSLERLNYFLERSRATMGASAPFSELSQLYPFYEQARMLATASKNTSAAMHEYSNYLPYDLIRSFAETHSLDHHIHPEIRRLAELEEKGSAELLLSLYSYLLNDRSYQTCAEKLNIHRNSFAYRINKVLSVLSCDWNDEHVRLSLLLSICMHWYLHPEQDPIGISRWSRL